jgi:acyl dehydratase
MDKGGERGPGQSIMDPQFLLGLPPRIITHSYTKRDTMLYALGVGSGQNVDNRAELPFLLESGLVALPSMAVVLAYPGFWQMEPQYGIDWRRVLHAEQSCEFHAPLPVEGEVRGELSIDAIVDKGADKGALLRAVRQIYDRSDNRLLATVRQVSYLRGDGGKGGGGAEIPALPAVPARTPDTVISLATRPEQALIYRLSGDYNPLHADPAAARDAGFSAPILHGLCTYGFAARGILAAGCGNDAARLKSLECRFTAPVYPGDTLEVRIWMEQVGQIAYQVAVPARDAIVIDRGRARIAPSA